MLEIMNRWSIPERLDKSLVNWVTRLAPCRLDINPYNARLVTLMKRGPRHGVMVCTGLGGPEENLVSVFRNNDPDARMENYADLTIEQILQCLDRGEPVVEKSSEEV